ncbi:glycerol-3-phosphate phosphatase-like [Diorhabda carinulata]|uniref:glycerol-3-phosphate phosphatase-like n=1 Tax=Diorhabda carinulata TaxID=1163345 RepID=UPI0025A0128D|nr:glycerol-3-phosphate phosphatase-like [Diorhabda carinulata]
MDKLKNLAYVSKEDQIEFLKSFDNVFFDLDGVVWLSYKPITGASDCINNLKKLKKRVNYLTNNAYKSPQDIANILNKLNHNVTSDDIINPIITIISFFKNINYNDEIYLIGSPALRQAMVHAGLNVVPEVSIEVDNELESFLQHYDENNKIKAVVVEIDLTMTYIKLQKCVWYLKQPDCRLVVGMSDKFVPVANRGPIIGMHYFVECLKAASGKEPIYVAKPSQYLVDFIKLKFNITNPDRTLIIGDSIEQDMVTAIRGGFQKLLVLSGTATKEHINNWKYPEENKPEYYIEDLNVLNTIIKSVFPKI